MTVIVQTVPLSSNRLKDRGVSSAGPGQTVGSLKTMAPESQCAGPQFLIDRVEARVSDLKEHGYLLCKGPINDSRQYVSGQYDSLGRNEGLAQVENAHVERRWGGYLSIVEQPGHERFSQSDELYLNFGHSYIREELETSRKPDGSRSFRRAVRVDNPQQYLGFVETAEIDASGKVQYQKTDDSKAKLTDFLRKYPNTATLTSLLVGGGTGGVLGHLLFGGVGAGVAGVCAAAWASHKVEKLTWGERIPESCYKPHFEPHPAVRNLRHFVGILPVLGALAGGAFLITSLQELWLR